jgi:hypothetical protein
MTRDEIPEHGRRRPPGPKDGSIFALDLPTSSDSVRHFEANQTRDDIVVMNTNDERMIDRKSRSLPFGLLLKIGRMTLDRTDALTE